MLDPIHSLAFSMQANRGVYALLLGSGVSRAAQIPTGWDITLDLVRKLATIQGESCEPTPERWYANKFGKAPDYSDLLDTLTKTPAERQQLLRSYWEPNDKEREDGAKQPTQTHRAIAALAAKGFVKVIITTNFDRLTETALVDAGVTPTVLSSPDQVHGALPLIHTQCCVFKVHGDYLDTRIRNTSSELASYPSEFDRFLDRVFDEFGVVICGWSAEWDEALRKAMFRATSRRFTTYWVLRGDTGEQARRLIDHRCAQVVPIKDADTFFQSLQRQVEALEEFSRPHPLSTEVAVASLKRYLAEPRYRIQLVDLVDETVNRVLEAVSGPAFAVQNLPEPTSETFTQRFRGYEAVCTTLMAMSAVGGFWSEENHSGIWCKTLKRLSTVQVDPKYSLTSWIELGRYPGALLLYSLGLGAVASERFSVLGQMFDVEITSLRGKDKAVRVLLPACYFSGGERAGCILDGMKDRRVPFSDWLHKTLREPSKQLFSGTEDYTLAFDKLEVLLALNYGHHTRLNGEMYHAPLGAFCYRKPNRDIVLADIEASIAGQGLESPFLQSCILGKDAATSCENLAEFKKFVSERCKDW